MSSLKDKLGCSPGPQGALSQTFQKSWPQIKAQITGAEFRSVWNLEQPLADFGAKYEPIPGYPTVHHSLGFRTSDGSIFAAEVFNDQVQMQFVGPDNVDRSRSGWVKFDGDGFREKIRANTMRRSLTMEEMEQILKPSTDTYGLFKYNCQTYADEVYNRVQELKIFLTPTEQRALAAQS